MKILLKIESIKFRFGWVNLFTKGQELNSIEKTHNLIVSQVSEK